MLLQSVNAYLTVRRCLRRWTRDLGAVIFPRHAAESSAGSARVGQHFAGGDVISPAERQASGTQRSAEEAVRLADLERELDELQRLTPQRDTTVESNVVEITDVRTVPSRVRASARPLSVAAALCGQSSRKCGYRSADAKRQPPSTSKICPLQPRNANAADRAFCAQKRPAESSPVTDMSTEEIAVALLAKFGSA